MKTKRLVSLLLALVMSLALAVPVFAAEPDDGDEGIMPLAQIFPDIQISQGDGDYRTRNFAATPGNGKTIHVWFRNDTDYPVEVYLYRTDKVNPVFSGTAPAHSDWPADSVSYTNSTADTAVYYVRLVLRGNHPISGRLAVAQY